MFLSVVIPAYNEEKIITKTLIEIGEYLSRQNFDYEIIVINDGSSDKTANLTKKLKPRIKNLQIIDNKKNRGKGFVVRQGLLNASGEYRLFTDADNSTRINQLKKLLPFCKEYDIIIGSRNIKGSIIKYPQSKQRRFLGNIFRFLVNVIFNSGVKDTQCGFKILNKKTAEKILAKCKINGWAFDVEILAIARKNGYKIKEVPIEWTNREESKINFWGMLNSLIELFKIKWNLFINYEI